MKQSLKAILPEIRPMTPIAAFLDEEHSACGDACRYILLLQ